MDQFVTPDYAHELIDGYQGQLIEPIQKPEHMDQFVTPDYAHELIKSLRLFARSGRPNIALTGVGA